jgi:DNA-directed RNA polymerase subunit H (RpoH/RPB5)
MTGKIIFSDPRTRGQLQQEGEVVTFHEDQRTTGSTWWSETRLGEKEGDVFVEEIATVSPTLDALESYRDRSGFDTVDDWIDTIERLNDGLPKAGYLYRVTAEIDD